MGNLLDCALKDKTMPKNATRKALAREAKSATRSASTKAKKQKLSPAERSQIARDRWAKIRKAKAAQDNKPDPVKEWVDEAVKDGLLTPVPPVVEQETIQTPSVLEASGMRVQVELDGGKTLAPAAPPVPAPAPQLATAKAPKQKRYTGPKEFSVALKAAENRLAKAIVERAQAAGSLAALNAEIPSLLQIIQALKGSSNVPAVPYDFSGSVPNATGFQNPIPPQFQPPVDPMDAIRAAMAAPPVSRAVGNAIQLPPDVVGELEGPDDDNPDKFITGPHAGGGWLGA